MSSITNTAYGAGTNPLAGQQWRKEMAKTVAKVSVVVLSTLAAAYFAYRQGFLHGAKGAFEAMYAKGLVRILNDVGAMKEFVVKAAMEEYSSMKLWTSLRELPQHMLMRMRPIAELGMEKVAGMGTRAAKIGRNLLNYDYSGRFWFAYNLTRVGRW